MCSDCCACCGFLASQAHHGFPTSLEQQQGHCFGWLGKCFRYSVAVYHVHAWQVVLISLKELSLRWVKLDCPILQAYLILSNCEANSYFALTWLVQIHFRELTPQCVLSLARRYHDMLCQREFSSYSAHCNIERHCCFDFDLYLTMIMCALSWTAPCDGHCRCWRCAHALAAVNISTPFSQLGCN